MAQVEVKNLTSSWEALGSSSGTTYRIQNRGANIVIAQEASSAPEAGNTDGIFVQPYKTVVYEQGTGDLYLRAFSGTASVNVSTEA